MRRVCVETIGLCDPKGKPMEEVRTIRDDIRDRVQLLPGLEGLVVTE
jgi:hypothetical protein